MNKADCRVLGAAAYEFSVQAQDIKESNTIDGKWTGDHGPAAKAWHDKCLQLAMRLRQIAKAERAKLKAVSPEGVDKP